MNAELKRVTVAPKGTGLNDFVAEQEGYFAAEGSMACSIRCSAGDWTSSSRIAVLRT